MERLDPSSLRPSLKLSETDMSRLGFEPRPPALRAAGLSGQLTAAYKEPLQNLILN
jgi:hypothetical protein